MDICSLRRFCSQKLTIPVLSAQMVIVLHSESSIPDQRNTSQLCRPRIKQRQTIIINCGNNRYQGVTLPLCYCHPSFLLSFFGLFEFLSTARSCSYNVDWQGYIPSLPLRSHNDSYFIISGNALNHHHLFKSFAFSPFLPNLPNLGVS